MNDDVENIENDGTSNERHYSKGMNTIYEVSVISEAVENIYNMGKGLYLPISYRSYTRTNRSFVENSQVSPSNEQDTAANVTEPGPVSLAAVDSMEDTAANDTEPGPVTFVAANSGTWGEVFKKAQADLAASRPDKIIAQFDNIEIDCVFHVCDPGNKIPVFGKALKQAKPTKSILPIEDIPKPLTEPISPLSENISRKDKRYVLNYYAIGETTTGSPKKARQKLYQMERILTVYKHYKQVDDILSIVRLVFFARRTDESEKIANYIAESPIKFPLLYRSLQAGRVYCLEVERMPLDDVTISLSDGYSDGLRNEDLEQARLDTCIRIAQLRNIEKDAALKDKDAALKDKDAALKDMEIMRYKTERLKKNLETAQSMNNAELIQKITFALQKAIMEELNESEEGK